MLTRVQSDEGAVPAAQGRPESQAPEITSYTPDRARRWLPGSGADPPSQNEGEQSSGLKTSAGTINASATRWIPKDHSAETLGSTLRLPKGLRADDASAESASRWLAGWPASAGYAQTVDPTQARSRSRLAEPALVPEVTVRLDPTLTQRAVRAYCRELCDPAHAEQPVGQTLSAFGAVAGASTGPEDRLLRITRATAAEGGPNAQAARCGRLLAEHDDEDACCPMVRLAARANGELDARQEADLKRHLDGCLCCQAAELKTGRAERAFAATLTGAVGAERPSPLVEPAA